MSCLLGTVFIVVLATAPVHAFRHEDYAVLAEDSQAQSAAKLKAVLDIFQRVVFDVHGVHINDGVFDCDGKSYSFEKALGFGAEGVTAILRRQSGGVKGQRVVAKLTKEPAMAKSGWGMNSRRELTHSAKTLKKECDISNVLLAAKVPNTLSCEASCQHGKPDSEHLMIVLEPFVEGAKPWTSTWIGGEQLSATERPFGPNSPKQITGTEAEPLDPRVEKGLRMTFTTVWGMLKAGIANPDQHHNVLFKEDGTPTFIDMGMAVNVNQKQTLGGLKPAWYVNKFLDAMFKFIPPLMLDWAESELLPHPPLAPELEAIVQARWPDWRKEKGNEWAREEADKLKKKLQELCQPRRCPASMCGYASFQECDKCPQCQSG